MEAFRVREWQDFLPRSVSALTRESSLKRVMPKTGQHKAISLTDPMHFSHVIVGDVVCESCVQGGNNGSCQRYEDSFQQDLGKTPAK